ncbi:MazG family protein [Nocardioides speluncae]|uniref:MazG family protein n=1 Tax=Nocardioides speluncae TaxID=2670337 RepID=UPI001F0B8E85|nr:MazG family protein [Nocardioides speluncae]
MPVEPVGDSLVELVEVMARLRAECDWKAAQTHRSLARYLLEEAHETLEAIDTGDLSHLREELGDLLLQVYFHAEIAREAGEFTIDDVAAGIVAKLKRRNPHVYGDASASGAASVNELWESIKAAEKQRTSVTDGLPPTLPALLYADKVLDRLARESPTGQFWSEIDRRPGTSGAAESADPSVSASSGIGDRLLALVAEARESGVDPEQALRDAVRRLL